jgi:hypothetical protein
MLAAANVARAALGAGPGTGKRGVRVYQYNHNVVVQLVPGAVAKGANQAANLAAVQAAFAAAGGAQFTFATLAKVVTARVARRSMRAGLIAAQLS